MKCYNIHSHPEHEHGSDCGHTSIRHNDHIDYVHDGHLHHPHEDHCDEHVIEASEINPSHCSPLDNCSEHMHGPECGHEAVPHEDHTDYIVSGRLHHVHEGHCDDHGPIEVLAS
ncbi:MAG: hypothetical protein AAF410_00900 [Pseudomonadota bacterium]